MPASSAADRAIVLEPSDMIGRLCGGGTVWSVVSQRLPVRGFQIVELPVIDGPEECPCRADDEHEAEGHEYEENVHGRLGRGSRRAALRTTAMELSDMPSAAIQGEMSPAAASGTEPKL